MMILGIELKPCPFCGDAEVKEIVTTKYGRQTLWWKAFIVPCCDFLFNADDYSDSEEAVIELITKKWNTRHEN